MLFESPLVPNEQSINQTAPEYVERQETIPFGRKVFLVAAMFTAHCFRRGNLFNIIRADHF